MELIFKALNFATKAHKGQTRRKTAPDLPYIVHPMGVAILLARIGADEKTIAAGLLHDVIEDCEVTKEEIEKEFGDEVAAMVDDVTEQNRDASWRERKEAATTHIKEMRHGSMLIKAADINHNLSSLVSAIEREGLSVLDKFNAPLPDQIEMFKKRNTALANAWAENPLLKELKPLIEDLEKLLIPTE